MTDFKHEIWKKQKLFSGFFSKILKCISQGPIVSQSQNFKWKQIFVCRKVIVCFFILQQTEKLYSQQKPTGNVQNYFFFVMKLPPKVSIYHTLSHFHVWAAILRVCISLRNPISALRRFYFFRFTAPGLFQKNNTTVRTRSCLESTSSRS